MLVAESEKCCNLLRTGFDAGRIDADKSHDDLGLSLPVEDRSGSGDQSGNETSVHRGKSLFADGSPQHFQPLCRRRGVG